MSTLSAVDDAVARPKVRTQMRTMTRRAGRTLVAGWLLAGLALAAAPPARAHEPGPEGFENDPPPASYSYGTTSQPCTPLGPFGLPGVSGPPSQIGQWSSVETWPERGTQAAVLRTGKVLWWRNAVAVPAQLYDPATSTHTPVPVPAGSGDWICPGLTQLSDGRILTAGGGGGQGFGQKSVIVFDPVSETWTRVADMQVARWYPTTKTLPDGRVLALNGYIIPGGIAPIPEIYDPDTNAWTLIPPAELVQPLYAFMFHIPSGGLVYAGNSGNSGSYTHPTWKLNLATQRWSFLGQQTYYSYQSSAAMYRPGKILKVGGEEPAVNTAEILDINVASPSWSPAAPMTFPRRRTDLVILPDGTLLTVGGSTATQDDPQCAVHAPERYDPATNTWTQWASMARTRIYHSTTMLLPDGRILAAGGENLVTAGEKNAEIFSPPYLFNGPRPSVTAGPSSAAYGQTITLTTPNAASIASVALMRPNAVTHNYDHDQMYVPLAFTAGAGSLGVTLPADANRAPPGYYMIFLVNNAGVPSVAHWLRVGPAPCPGQDSDGDTILNCEDNCPAVANGPAQAGVPGVGNQTDSEADASGDACDADDDNDLLNDVVETDTGTYVSPSNTGSDRLLFDTDVDGLSDGDEVLIHGSNPVLLDTDGDGLADGAEIEDHHTDPTDPDTDDDGLLDQSEVVTHHTDPTNPDTDGDGYNDGFEVSRGSDPNDPDSLPPIPALPVWGGVVLAGLVLATAARIRARARR